MGSEPGMAWNWCVNLAQYCELHIITEGEFRHKIEKALPMLPKGGGNMHFYYNPVPDRIRRMCWNQGDWRFYKYYKEWQYKTYEMALEIIETHKIDIVHQLNMIGFREPGYLWKIDGIPFVWGPVGGIKTFPTAYLNNAGIKQQLFHRLKNALNILQLKYSPRVRKALRRADLIISAIPDSYFAIKKYHGLESVIIPETGCYENQSPYSHDENSGNNINIFNIIWVGKFDYRKQLNIALQTIAHIKNDLSGDRVQLHIIGTGSPDQISYYKKISQQLEIDDVVKWHGQIANNEVMDIMSISQLFFFTSVNEDTSTVVLEALSNKLPVVCFNACGFGAVIDDTVGYKIDLTTPKKSAKEFADKICYLYNHKDILQTMANNCTQRRKELSWERKAEQMVAIYDKVLNKQAID